MRSQTEWIEDRNKWPLWHIYTAAESFERFIDGQDSYVAHGDLLEGWNRTLKEDRAALLKDPLPEAPHEPQWTAFWVATVVQLCVTNGILIPDWVIGKQCFLPEPWYPEVKNEKLREIQRETTPFIFALYNVFAGDNVLCRV
jgi:hypothetical protein